MPIEQHAKFQIFKKSGSPDLLETDHMSYDETLSQVEDKFGVLMNEGLDRASEIKVLVDIPGFSLVYSWFKSGMPLPLHSHDSDCLYYIVAGTLRLGGNELTAGDSFFVPADVPYTYSVGEAGLEILEFRHVGKFNFHFGVKGAAPFWEKAIQQVREHRDLWPEERRPSEAALAAVE